jgi:hypothetical protein
MSGACVASLLMDSSSGFSHAGNGCAIQEFSGWNKVDHLKTVPGAGRGRSGVSEAAFVFQEPGRFKKPRNPVLHHFLCKMEVAEIKELIGRRPETLSNSPEKRLFSEPL